jgi:hypothetical protein
MSTEFHNNLSKYFDVNNTKDANRLLMSELGKILVKDRNDFIFMLTESGVYADSNMSDSELVNIFVDNLSKNKKLRLGASLLVNMHNKQMNFDGSNDLSDDGVKMSMIVLDEYHCFDDEETSNVGGAWAKALEGVVGLGGKIAEGQQKKKFGVTDSIAKQKESKNALMQQILAKKQADADALKKSNEDKQKTKRTLLYVGGGVLALAIIVATIYFIKKRKK